MRAVRPRDAVTYMCFIRTVRTLSLWWIIPISGMLCLAGAEEPACAADQLAALEPTSPPLVGSVQGSYVGTGHGAWTQRLPVAQTFDPWKVIDRDVVALLRLEGKNASVTDIPGRSEAPDNGLLSRIALLLSRELGVLLEGHDRLRLWSDLTSGLVSMLRYPLTLAVLDVRVAVRSDGGHELDEIQMALLVETGSARGDREDMVRQQIQHLLNTYTNVDHTRLVQREQQGRMFYELTDDRLPAWARIGWVDMGAGYIITFGDKAMSRVMDALAARRPNLGTDEWMCEAQRACRRAGPEMTWYVNVDALRQAHPRETHEGFIERVNAVFRLFRLSGASRLYGVVSRDGRVVESSLFVRQLDENRLIRIADHAYLKSFGYDLIPSEASVFAVVDARFSTLIPDMWEAYVASRGPASSAALRQALADIEKESGVSARDLFAKLSDRIIIHDFPQHALRLPVARTILVPLRDSSAADRATFRERLDRFMNAAGKRIETGGSAWTLCKDPDGVWFIRFGLEGPAMTVAGRWLVISYSPYAVRENVKRLQARQEPQMDMAGQ